MLTIAVTGAKDGSDGCFIPRQPSSRLVRMLYHNRCGVRQGHFYAQDHSDSYRTSVQRGPLSDRGWALQERILSRRIVHYTQGRVYYECQIDRPRSENHNLVRSSKIEPAEGSEFFDPAGADIVRLPDEPLDKTILRRSGGSLFLRWYHLIESYSGTRLTYQKDRLIAIEGMVPELQLMILNLPKSPEKGNGLRKSLAPYFIYYPVSHLPIIDGFNL